MTLYIKNKKLTDKMNKSKIKKAAVYEKVSKDDPEYENIKRKAVSQRRLPTTEEIPYARRIFSEDYSPESLKRVEGRFKKTTESFDKKAKTYKPQEISMPKIPDPEYKAEIKDGVNFRDLGNELGEEMKRLPEDE